MAKKKTKVTTDALDQLIEATNKSMKQTALIRGTPLAKIKGFFSTGNTLFDLFCYGGIPKGRFTEIYGAESGGKSTLAAQIIAEAQKEGALVTVLDSEASMTPESVSRCGADLSKIAWHDSYIVEDGFEVITQLIRQYKGMPESSRPPLLIVWDTIAASPTQKEYDEGAGLADKPRVLSAGFRRITQDVANLGVAILFLNQVREKIGAYGDPEFSPGGRAVRHHSSLRVKLNPGAKIKHGQVEVGQTIHCRVQKCKYGSPGRKLSLPLFYEHGFDECRSLIYWLMDKERGGPLAKKKSGVYQAGAYYKVDLPGLKKPLSFFDRHTEVMLGKRKIGDELRAFLRQRARELWVTA